MGPMLMLATAMAAQAAAPAQELEQVDVAYVELADGKVADALTKLEQSELVRAGDPAALINLGTAYARLGNVEKARECYDAAMSSEDRYVLELANGRWMDSRRLAKMASDALARGEVLALR